MITIAALENLHHENEQLYDSENSGEKTTLSDIICPKFFKLSFSTHGQRFAKEHFRSSLQSGHFLLK